MDWTQVIVALISSGAFLGIFLVTEKKSAAVLESVDKRSSAAIESAQKLGDGYQEIAQSWEHRAEQLQNELDRKNDKIDELHRQMSDMSRELDRAHSGETLAKMMICDKTACQKRRPPFGKGVNYDISNPFTDVDPDTVQGDVTE